MSSIDALSQHLVPATLVVARVSGLAIHGPVLSSPSIPLRIKGLLVAALGLAVYPSVAGSSVLPSEISLGVALPLVAIELGIGAFIGFMASMPLLAAQFGGLSMGQQIGLGFARFYNPAIGEESDALEQILFFLALATFLSLGGLESMFSAVVGSFTSIPAGAVPDMLAGKAGVSPLAVFTGALTAAFELGLRVAAPLLAIVCLETVVMGYLSKSVPALNIMSIGFPLRIVVGLMVVIASLAAIDETLVDGTSGALESLLSATVQTAASTTASTTAVATDALSTGGGA
ncbi:MAG: flagellar biosynthetic protein FliR [Planctomycetaceae bacterium]|nr:flagellar biosynthetic protein FliR [Planctomycetaceae bacterium]